MVPVAALLAAVVLAAACAVVEPPPGGPLDIDPPWLVASTPDSGAVGVGPVTTLRFRFSEKMDRKPAVGWLYFFPDQRIRRTKWHGAVEAEVELESPLPPDTTIVIELASRLTDAHKVKSRTGRRFPIATGASIPSGSLAGVLVMGDSAVTRGVVELYDLPTDSLTFDDMPMLRRTVTDRTGAYVFDWLPVPGGPWLLRAFVDKDGDLRPGDKEAVRLLPDTLAITADSPAAAAAVATLYPPDTPGRLLVRPFTLFGAAEPVVFFTQRVTDADTGWTPQPVADARTNFKVLPAAAGGAIDKVAPGANRVAMFVDIDRDTTFGPVPRDAVQALGLEFSWNLSDPAGDTTGWYLEPLVVVEAPAVDPGLDTWWSVPDSTALLVPWPAPPPAEPDSSAAAADTSAAAAPEPAEER
jgi:hypothetical protein